MSIDFEESCRDFYRTSSIWRQSVKGSRLASCGLPSRSIRPFCPSFPRFQRKTQIRRCPQISGISSADRTTLTCVRTYTIPLRLVLHSTMHPYEYAYSSSSSQHSVSPSPFDYMFQQPFECFGSSDPAPLPKSRPPKSAPQATRQVQISHPYARLFAKKDEVKRRKIWNHALEKSLFSPFELQVLHFFKLSFVM